MESYDGFWNSCEIYSTAKGEKLQGEDVYSIQLMSYNSLFAFLTLFVCISVTVSRIADKIGYP